MNKYEIRHYAAPPPGRTPLACRPDATPAPLAPYVAVEPMLLPWLARKAGIDDALSRAIWRKAESHARHHAVFGSPDYFELAVNRLLSRLSDLARSRKSTPHSLQTRTYAGGEARHTTRCATDVGSRPGAIFHPHYVRVPDPMRTPNLWRPDIAPRHGGSR